jgi:hypothetical protein
VSYDTDAKPANRAELVRSILIWERAAARIADITADLRSQLAADARAEYDEQGTAPTWRLPDLATVTLPVSKTAVVVTDERELVKWAVVRRPDAIEPRIRPASLKALLSEVVTDGELPHLEDGEFVPGVEVRPGGIPKALSVRASAEAAGVLKAEAASVLAAIAAAMGEPVGLESPE